MWNKKENVHETNETDGWFGNTATPYESPFNVAFLLWQFPYISL